MTQPPNTGCPGRRGPSPFPLPCPGSLPLPLPGPFALPGPVSVARAVAVPIARPVPIVVPGSTRRTGLLFLITTATRGAHGRKESDDRGIWILSHAGSRIGGRLAGGLQQPGHLDRPLPTLGHGTVGHGGDVLHPDIRPRV